jgi:oligoendopeptidase F
MSLDFNKVKLNWDFSKYYTGPDDEKIKKDVQAATIEVDKFKAKWQGKLQIQSDVVSMKNALDDYNTLQRDYSFAGASLIYAELKFHENMTDEAVKKTRAFVEEKFIENINKLEFFTQLVAKVSKENQEKFLNCEELSEYRNYLKMQFASSKYLLSEQVEEVLNYMSKPGRKSWIEMLDGALEKEKRSILNENEEEFEAGLEEMMSLLTSPKQNVRDIAAAAVDDVNKTLSHLATAELNSIMEFDKINAKLRGYSRYDEMKHLADDVESEIVDVLDAAVTKRFDIPQRFYKLKARLFGKEKLQYHERNLSYGNLVKTITFEESCNIIDKVCERLHPTFQTEYHKFLYDGRVSVYPTPGKAGGAFCMETGLGGKFESYILLNQTDKLRDVTTFAHELGHGFNHQLIPTKQNALQEGISFFCAETASTFMEDFVFQELEKTIVSDEEKLALLIERINDNVSTVFRQTACGNLQRDLNDSYKEKGVLSVEDISEKMAKHMHSYMGDGVEPGEKSKYWWVYWSHIRGYKLYSYVAGLLLGSGMQRLYLQDNSKIEDIIEWYKCGLNNSPYERFLKLGLDIKSEKTWLDAIEKIEEMLIQAEKLVEKLGK